VDLDTGLVVEGDIRAMKITVSQQVTIEVGKPVDRKGKPAKIQPGSMKFVCSDDSAVLTQDPSNEFKCLVAGANENEVTGAVITFTADADLGDGVTEISGIEPLVVTSGPAVGFGPVVVGTPEEQP
jgi:hypothetical protein